MDIQITKDNFKVSLNKIEEKLKGYYSLKFRLNILSLLNSFYTISSTNVHLNVSLENQSIKVRTKNIEINPDELRIVLNRTLKELKTEYKESLIKKEHVKSCLEFSILVKKLSGKVYTSNTNSLLIVIPNPKYKD